MNSRERVLSALNHEAPDRGPIEFGSRAVSSILIAEPYGYRALRAHLGVDDYLEPEINL